MNTDEGPASFSIFIFKAISSDILCVLAIYVSQIRKIMGLQILKIRIEYEY